MSASAPGWPPAPPGLAMRAVQKAFRSLGFTFERQGEPHRAAMDFDPPLSVLYNSTDPIFNLDIDRIRHRMHFGWGPDGWDPLVAALRGERRTGSISAAAALLADYLERRRGRNLAEMYFPHEPRWADVPCLLAPVPRYDVMPWMFSQLPRRRSPASPAEHGEGARDRQRSDGASSPISHDLRRWTRREVERLVRLRNATQRHGYRPGGRYGRDIEGMFLRWGQDWRFLIHNGHHRMSVLADLGYERVRVRFSSAWPRAADLRDLEEWPGVISGQFDAAAAREIFVRHFTENGRQKAARLGMLP